MKFSIYFIWTLQVILWISFGPMVHFADSLYQVNLAENFVHGAFQFDHHYFDHRFFVFGPTAFISGLLGFSKITVNLWPLICSMGITYLLHAILPKERWSSVLISMWAVYSPSIIYSSILLPDIPLTFVSLLYYYYSIHSQKHQPMLLAGVLLLGVFTKISFLLLIPAIIIAQWISQPEKIKMQLGSVGIGLGIFFSFYQWVFGNWLFRFQLAEELHNKHFKEWPNSTDKINRLTNEWWEFISNDGLLWFGLVVSIVAIYAFIQKKITPGLTVAAILFLFYSFGSTSIQQYTPMPILSRIWLPVTVFIMIGLADWKKEIRLSQQTWLFLFIATIVAIPFNSLGIAMCMSLFTVFFIPFPFRLPTLFIQLTYAGIFLFHNSNQLDKNNEFSIIEELKGRTLYLQDDLYDNQKYFFETNAEVKRQSEYEKKKGSYVIIKRNIFTDLDAKFLQENELEKVQSKGKLEIWE